MTKRYSVTRSIQATPAVVWGLLTDASTYADWNPTIVSIQGPIGLNGTVSLVSTVNPKRTFKVKVDVMEPSRRLVWSDGMPLGLFKGERTFLLEPSGGGTQFTMTEEYTGLMSGLIFKSIPDLTESFNQFADGLKSAAEAARS
jgi:hypothetical protein